VETKVPVDMLQTGVKVIKCRAWMAVTVLALGLPHARAQSFDPEAEAVLLNLANRARAEAGVAPLRVDPGLTQAARAHSAVMANARHIGHQLEDEPTLLERLASATQLTLEREGENVALDQDAQGAADGLMHSPPHRKNLLDPSFNVVGIGVVQQGQYLWVTQDFGAGGKTLTAEEVENTAGEAVVRFRATGRLPILHRAQELGLREAACSMAKADNLWTQETHRLTERYQVVTYTSMHPETLPAEATGILSDSHISTYAVGACHARTRSYPLGVYWVMLLLR
jgi:uncharacterized protein YkwD